LNIPSFYKTGKCVVSFEVFSPKRDDDISKIYSALDGLAALRPDFISVTYGAGGGGAKKDTARIAGDIQNKYSVAALAHLTCINADKEKIKTALDAFEAKGVNNILALRGDLPEGLQAESGYKFAKELIKEIRLLKPSFSVGAACYPEGHISCADSSADIEYMLEKQEAGADFFITQLFFDNDLFLRFRDAAVKKGVKKPISAGIMPMLSRKQIEKMIFTCGASLPSAVIKLLHKYDGCPEDIRKAGINYAAEQSGNLVKQGAQGVHIYTMNHPDIAEKCVKCMR
jgi:methylenetetrahydrofolate reductase (NADPH)